MNSLINLTTSATSSKEIEGPMGRLNSSSAIFSVIGNESCGLFQISLE